MAANPGAPLLLALMRAWWTGATVAQMARTHGLTARRVRDLLRGVGCRMGAGRNITARPDSRRPVPPQRVADAMAMMNHHRFARLTIRQRGAVAWTASGLSSRDIAKRMGLSGQRVRVLIVSASNRLRRQPRPAPTRDRADDMSTQIPVPAVCWDGMFDSLTGPWPESTENAHED